MNNVHDNIDAAAGAQCSGRYSFIRRFALGLVLGCAALSAAHAGPGQGELDAQRAAQAQQIQRQQQERNARQFDSRQFEARADEQRRNLQMQQEQNAHNESFRRSSGRLTPDERRDLRRQINEAGMDLYPNKARR